MVPCFNDTLVQANLANVRELKRAISNLETEKIANFSLALTTAFDLLESYRTEREGARCNQAIMLITDGVPYNYKEIFETYNWRDNPDEPFKADMPVRMFTYLIGREVADVREVQWMACANRGFFVHLCTLAEVREEVNGNSFRELSTFLVIRSSSGSQVRARDGATVGPRPKGSSDDLDPGLR